MPNQRIAALINSRRCFECQIDCGAAAEDVPLPIAVQEREAGRAGMAGLRDPCGLRARAARLSEAASVG